MKIKVGCSVKEYLVSEGENVIASWSLGFEESGCTVGSTYKVKGISSNKNLIIENDNEEEKEYSPLHFHPCS